MSIILEKKKISHTFIKQFSKSILLMVPKLINKIIIKKNELTIYAHASNLNELLFFFKHHTNCQFKLLIDIVGVDYPSKKKRFEVVYHLLSVKFNFRISIKTYTDELTAISSIHSLYSAAIWMEREVWDLLGVFFNGNPDLRRILTDYGFEGFPLRKDFPLNGYTEVRYDDSLKRIVTEPLEITQEFRNFDFLSPWENKNKK